MTAGTLVLAGARPDRVGWQHVRQLTAIEARKYALRASVWIGWAATVLLARRRASAPLAAGLAGLVVMTFEFVQVVSIGSPPGPSRTMQVGYFALGAGIAAAALAMARGYGDRLPR